MSKQGTFLSFLLSALIIGLIWYSGNKYFTPFFVIGSLLLAGLGVVLPIMLASRKPKLVLFASTDDRLKPGMTPEDIYGPEGAEVIWEVFRTGKANVQSRDEDGNWVTKKLEE